MKISLIHNKILNINKLQFKFKIDIFAWYRGPWNVIQIKILAWKSVKKRSSGVFRCKTNKRGIKIYENRLSYRKFKSSRENIDSGYFDSHCCRICAIRYDACMDRRGFQYLFYYKGICLVMFTLIYYICDVEF